MVKSLPRKQILFFQNITTATYRECRQIVNFNEMDTEWSTGKKYGF